MKSKRSYSLSDLIVTIICVCFLTVNLAMIGSGGRKRAKEALCKSNLRRWGQIFTAFVTDNDGYYMMRDDSNEWYYFLSGYYDDKRLLLCPEATVPWTEGMKHPNAAWVDDYRGGTGSYGINLWISDEDSDDDTFWRTPYQSLASQIPVLGGSMWKDIQPSHYDSALSFNMEEIWFSFVHNTNEMTRVCVNRHNGGPNLLFMDNSVRKVGMKELWELPWHRDWNPNNDPPPDYPNWPEWMANFKEYYQP